MAGYSNQYSDELMHYGVLGMKWGVRRYQNRGGSYTKKGLARFKENESKYDAAKSRYDSVKKTGDKREIRSAKRDTKVAKKRMSNAYGQLKRDYRADKGKDLYAEGKTITGNQAKNNYGQAGIAIGTQLARVAAKNALDKRQAVLINKKYGTIPLSRLSDAAISVGGAVAQAILAGKTYSENRNLRAYYNHSGNRNWS